MNKTILIALIALAVLAAAVFYFNGRQKKHSVTFKGPSGKTATLTVD